MGIAEWVVEVALVALLGASIVYALRLEKALAALRRDRATLQGSAEGFGDALREVQVAMAQLRTTAETSGRQMGERVAKAEAIAGKLDGMGKDLPFMLERAEALADRLDALVRTARPLAAQSIGGGGHAGVSRGGSMGGADHHTSSAPDLDGGSVPYAPKSQAERELMQALKVVR